MVRSAMFSSMAAALARRFIQLAAVWQGQGVKGFMALSSVVRAPP